MSMPKSENISGRPSQSAASDRHQWPALDALRGLAMLLGVALHAAVSYMPHAMPDLLWAIRDDSTNPLFDWIFWSIHAFRLPLFFAIAGFLTVRLQISRGTYGYVIHRTRRLLLPLIVAALILLPLTFGVWASGWLMSGACTFRDIGRMIFEPPIQTNLRGPAHLWFLEYLYIMCLLYALMCWFFDRWSIRQLGIRSRYGRIERALASVWFPLVPAAMAASIIWWDPKAICGFHNTFMPEWPRFTYYGVFFGTGILLARAGSNLQGFLEPRSGWLLVSGLPFLVLSGLLLQEYLDHGLSGPGRLALGVCFGLVASLWLFGLLGLALRWCPHERPLLRYLADASYWIYLVHFPLVGLVQVLLAPALLPAVAKFTIVMVVVLAIGFISYHRCIRFTLLGRFLNGTRLPPAIPLQTSRAAAA